MPGKEGSAGQMRSRRADEITKKEERRNRRRGGCKGFEGSVVCRVLGQWLPGQTGVGSWVPERHLLTMQKRKTKDYLKKKAFEKFRYHL